ncbi:SymE family type I addiction module toxin [Xenorhabdus sp. PB30.3]|uniref:SymE family type I addiction module toxin n=1 Tax=Xenorhabdus sp. PB30.3 TaxID=2788941 RepID=UPI00351D8DE5
MNTCNRTRHEDRNTGKTRYYSQHPSLHLKGNWLEEAAFTTGQAVNITVERGATDYSAH